MLLSINSLLVTNFVKLKTLNCLMEFTASKLNLIYFNTYLKLLKNK